MLHLAHGINYPLEEIRNVSASNQVPTDSKPTDNKPTNSIPYEDFTLSYQKAYNEVYGAKYGRLAEDGLRGPATRASLSHIYLTKGQRNSLVKWCQDRLINHKHYTIPYGADGVFGSGTENIVKQFQRDNRLAVDGIIGKNTINLLF